MKVLIWFGAVLSGLVLCISVPAVSKDSGAIPGSAGELSHLAIAPLRIAYEKYPEFSERLFGLSFNELAEMFGGVQFNFVAKGSSVFLRSTTANCLDGRREVRLFEPLDSSSPNAAYFVLHEGLCALGFNDHTYALTTIIAILNKYEISSDSTLLQSLIELADLLGQQNAANTRFQVLAEGGTKIGGGGDQFNLDQKIATVEAWFSRRNFEYGSHELIAGLKIILATGFEKYVRAKKTFDFPNVTTRDRKEGDDNLLSKIDFLPQVGEIEISFGETVLTEAQRNTSLARRFLSGPERVRVANYFVDTNKLEKSKELFLSLVEYALDPGEFSKFALDTSSVHRGVTTARTHNCMQFRIGTNANEIVTTYLKQTLTPWVISENICQSILKAIIHQTKPH